MERYSRKVTSKLLGTVAEVVVAAEVVWLASIAGAASPFDETTETTETCGEPRLGGCVPTGVVA